MKQSEDPFRDQARAIQEQHAKRQPASTETPQQARLRTQIERERKERPMTGGKS